MKLYGGVASCRAVWIGCKMLSYGTRFNEESQLFYVLPTRLFTTGKSHTISRLLLFSCRPSSPFGWYSFCTPLKDMHALHSQFLGYYWVNKIKKCKNTWKHNVGWRKMQKIETWKLNRRIPMLTQITEKSRLKHIIQENWSDTVNCSNVCAYHYVH